MKRLILIALTAVSLLAGAVALHASPVFATAADEICSGVETVSGGAGCSNPAGSPTIDSVITKVVNILSAFVGVLAVIMIIFAGFRYITAAGDSGRIAGAKNTLIYAVIGLIVAGTSQLIVRYVVVNVVK